MKRVFYVVIMLAITLSGCGAEDDAPEPSPGVSWELARHRARTLSDVRYEVAFFIPEALDDPIRGQETIRFHLSESGQPLVVDFNQPADKVSGSVWERIR